MFVLFLVQLADDLAWHMSWAWGVFVYVLGGGGVTKKIFNLSLQILDISMHTVLI